MAHITGGGFLENIPRVLPGGWRREIDLGAVPVPPVFVVAGAKPAASAQNEMLRTFNCGIGMVVVVDPERAEPTRWPRRWSAAGETVQADRQRWQPAAGRSRGIFTESGRRDAPTQKRVVVLVSGRGTNMTALIEAAMDPAYPAAIRRVICKPAAGARRCQRPRRPALSCESRSTTTANSTAGGA